MTETEVAVAMPQTNAVAHVNEAPAQVFPHFKAHVEAAPLKHFLKATKLLADEVKLRVLPEGLSVKVLDPAHVAMLAIDAPSRAFRDYKAGDGEFGLDLDHLRDFVKAAGQGADIRLALHGERNRIEYRTEDGGFAEYALVDTACMPDPKVPDLNLPARVTVQAIKLQKALKACRNVSDHTRLALGRDGKLIVHSDGDASVAHTEIQGEDGRITEPARSLFSLDYLRGLIDAIPGNEAVTLHLGTDYPVRIQWTAFGIHYDALLAPRIESD